MEINGTSLFSYEIDPQYATAVAYFSMEFAIDQALKIYSGGLGFLSGSHLRSAYELRHNLLGIGILWKYGYYDQQREENGMMKPCFTEKDYFFLRDTGIVITLQVHNSPVHVKAYLLDPEIFGTAPLLLLSTDLAENDEESRSITHHLYDPNQATRIAQSIVLGTGGAMVLDALKMTPEVYHLNEGHGVSLGFYLYEKYRNLLEVRSRIVFTTHTPELAGNEVHSFALLEEMSFFFHLDQQQARLVLDIEGPDFNFTLAALKFARKANGVSRMHTGIAKQNWSGYSGICDFTAITNAQNKRYWMDKELSRTMANGDAFSFWERKKALKRDLFRVVADQCGKLFNENKLTMVWAKRFAGYKRADLILRDWKRFLRLIKNTEMPIQMIWAGKPYPGDLEGITLFNKVISLTKPLANCAVLTGYELELSALLKKGSEVWLNNPRMYHEASGTSGMSAAMNGSVNLSIPDGWIPEFAKDGENCFLIHPAVDARTEEEADRLEQSNLMDKLEREVLPTYFRNKELWFKILSQAAKDIDPAFESSRLACQYYRQLYQNTSLLEIKQI